MREHHRNKMLAPEHRFGHLASRSCGQISAGRQVARSVNGGGPDGLATMGCDQAEGSPKGEAPVASATRRCKQSPTSPLRQQARVRKPASAPGVNLVRIGPLLGLAQAARERSYARSPTSLQRSSSREQVAASRRLGGPVRGPNHRSASHKQRTARQKHIAAPLPKNFGASCSTPTGSAA